MRERPILFSGPMVRAILAGTKTQTRRVIKPQPPSSIQSKFPYPQIRGDSLLFCESSKAGDIFPCWKYSIRVPFEIGMQLWVRETWCDVPATGGCERKHPTDGYTGVRYQTTWDRSHGTHWRPSIFMPRWASRITLQITTVRAHLLQDICEEDAMAEGVEAVSVADVPRNAVWTARQDFAQLWDKINGNRPGCGWASNPLVWVISFRKVDQ